MAGRKQAMLLTCLLHGVASQQKEINVYIAHLGKHLYLAACLTFWRLWATLEDEELSWATH